MIEPKESIKCRKCIHMYTFYDTAFYSPSPHFYCDFYSNIDDGIDDDYCIDGWYHVKADVDCPCFKEREKDD